MTISQNCGEDETHEFCFTEPCDCACHKTTITLELPLRDLEHIQYLLNKDIERLGEFRSNPNCQAMIDYDTQLLHELSKAS